jgi:hypothetical protein
VDDDELAAEVLRQRVASEDALGQLAKELRRSRGRALRWCDAAAACASPSRSARPYAEVSSVGAGGAEASVGHTG